MIYADSDWMKCKIFANINHENKKIIVSGYRTLVGYWYTHLSCI